MTEASTIDEAAAPVAKRFRIYLMTAMVAFVLLAGGIMAIAVQIRLSVANDVADYIAVLENSAYSQDERTPLVKRMENITELSRSGYTVGFWRWRGHDARIRAALAGGTTADLELVRRELEAIDIRLVKLAKKRTR